ncbi:MAG: DEAD/DEAH box helicase [Myxococcales bacterium]
MPTNDPARPGAPSTAAPAAPLAALLPAAGAPPLSTDIILDRFVAYVAGAGFSLYPAQEEAILELLAGKHLILNTPTGSGKSLVATALHFKAMAEGQTSFYTCPIKALVNEKFFALCQAFGPDNVGMVTGDASINRGAPIVCCTAEILANLSLRDPALHAGYVIMDEFHYYADKERGSAWQIPLLLLRDTTFLLMSATLGDMRPVAESLRALTGREVAQIASGERPVPLDYEYRETPLHETIEALIASRRAPIYLVNFTQRAAAEQAQNLMSANFSGKDEKEALKTALEGFRFDTPYGKELQRFLRHGIGLHHAGLLPKYRLLVEKLAQQGLLKIISGTDTLGVGVNIPIRTVLFTQLCKFDGEKVGVLSVRDFLQVGGRAGRKGFDDRGSVVAQAPEHVIENLKLSGKKAAGKKVVLQKPPQKGYAHWDRATFDKLLVRPPEPLESRFQVTHGLLLNLLQADVPEGGYRRLVQLVGRSHGTAYAKKQNLKAAAVAFHTLRAAGLVSAVRRTPARAAHLEVDPALQDDFSLNHTLSLYLLDTLPRLDPASETYARDVLTLVESILENPQTVLYAQLDKVKTAAMDEMKAQGVEYEERIARLQTLEWPKPNREFVYTTFNAFAARHPWVGEENIRPKSIAREMFEACASFNDYVRDYGLQRSEGVLLRYLADVYKTLVQNVPSSFRFEEVDDVLAFLRAVLRQVDSSLIDEWERLRDPAFVAAAAAKVESPARARPPPLEGKPLAARVRTDLHRLLKALSTKDYVEAALALWTPPGDDPWTPERLAAALEPYWAEHAAIDVTPRARRPDKTHLAPDGDRRWVAQQRIVDPDGEEDWMLDCAIDLSEPRDEDLPLIALRRIGT